MPGEFSAGPRSGLASPLTSFIGREEAIELLIQVLGKHRLVTLTGSGGCGKTRLAVEVARRVEPDFADGLATVDLSPIGSSDLLASVVAGSVGVSEAGGVSVATLLRHGLADRQLILLMDNCEHLLEASAELLADLLVHCPELTVLATSRSPLGVDGELMWRVPSLSIPPAGSPDPLADTTASESGQLLLDRVRLTRPDYTITEADAEDVAAICRRLDGVPLAIELAAARLRALSMPDVLAGLDHRFRLLSAGPRTAPPRQRTLLASIDWSHDLLDDVESTLFRRLAVFAGPFTVSAVEDVCSGGPLASGDIRSLLAGLVDQSLVQPTDSEGRRYRFLETVRAYARVKLTESGEEATFQGRHLEQVAQLTAWYDSFANGEGLEAAHAAVEPMLDEIRGALEWCLHSGRIDDGLCVAADLRMFWLDRDRNQEGRDWLDALIAADVERGRTAASHARARAELAAAHLCLFANDPITQEDLCHRALEAARELDDAVLETTALAHLGWAQVITDPAGAGAVLETAIEVGQEIDDRASVEFASLALGTRSLLAGDLELARRALASAVDIADDRHSLGLIYGIPALGYVETLRGRPAVAVAALRECTARYSFMRRPGRNLEATMSAFPLMILGRWDEARRQLTELIDRANVVGNPPVYAQIHLSLLDHTVGDHESCLAGVRDFEPLLGVPGFSWFRVLAMVWKGDALADRGDLQGASDHRREAKVMAIEIRNPLAATATDLALGRSASAAGDVDEALALTRSALRCAVDSDYGIGVVDAVEALAVLPGPDRAPLLASVNAERSRTGYVRFPIHEHAYAEAMAEVDERPARPLEWTDAVDLALGDTDAGPRPTLGWESLTAAELRVVELVAEGLTNPEVGERLFISRRTVQAHLSHIYAKLDIANRVELAALVAGHRRER